MGNNIYKFNFEKDNFFWDKDNSRLIQYGSNTIDFSDYQGGISVAFPIPINEAILKNVLGFQNDGKGGYIKDSIQIVLNAKDTVTLLTCFGVPIVFLNDLQNVCKKNGQNLNIDTQKLQNFLIKQFS